MRHPADNARKGELEHFGLVCTISQKVLHGISPNLHSMCILLSFQHLLNMGEQGDLDLHLQGHLGKKPLKLGHFGAYLHDQSRSQFFTYGLQTWWKYSSYKEV